MADCRICKKPLMDGLNRIYMTVECTHKFHQSCLEARCKKYKTRKCPICTTNIKYSCAKLTEPDIRKEYAYEYLMQILTDRKHEYLEDQFMEGVPTLIREGLYGTNPTINGVIKVGMGSNGPLYLNAIIQQDLYNEIELVNIFKLIAEYEFNLYQTYIDSFGMNENEPLIISLLKQYNEFKNKDNFRVIFDVLMDNLDKGKVEYGELYDQFSQEFLSTDMGQYEEDDRIYMYERFGIAHMMGQKSKKKNKNKLKSKKNKLKSKKNKLKSKKNKGN